jgi:Tol biopolymer transport system component
MIRVILASMLLAAFSLVISPPAQGQSQPTATPSDDRHSLIAFVSRRDGDDEIYLMNPDGSNPVNLSNSPGLDTAPQWAFDGSQILFMSVRDSRNVQSYIMDADGSNPVKLTESDYWERLITSGFVDVDQVSFSPDGANIVFQSTRDGNDEIYVMSIEGNSDPVNVRACL